MWLACPEIIILIIIFSLPGNATIEFDEFLGMMEEKMRSVIPDDTLQEAFEVFDKDGNGFISLDELRHVMSCLGVVLSKTEVQKMMEEADMDKDGMLNFKGEY